MLNDPDMAALYRNVCMIVAALAAARIVWLGFRRYKTEPRWQIVFMGGMLLLFAYLGILATSNFGDTFFELTHRGPASANDYAYLLKGGLVVALLGAFSVSKTLRS